MPDLDWVTDEQQRQLEVISYEHGDWREWLPEWMGEHWPDWSDAQPETQVAWLDEWLPTLRTPSPDQEPVSTYAETPVEAVEAPVEAVAADVRDLGWVTEDQLARLAGAVADWPTWLAAKLDELWPEWTVATPDVLVPWLDGWLPTLVGTGADEPETAAAEFEPTSAESEHAAEPTSAEVPVEDPLERALVAAIEESDVDPEVVALLAEDPDLQAYLAELIAEQAAQSQEVSS